MTINILNQGILNQLCINPVVYTLRYRYKPYFIGIELAI